MDLVSKVRWRGMTMPKARALAADLGHVVKDAIAIAMPQHQHQHRQIFDIED